MGACGACRGGLVGSDAQALTVRAIDPATAAGLMAGLEAIDPTGMLKPGGVADLCERSQCFELVAGPVRFVWAAIIRNDVLWLQAGKSANDRADAMPAIVRALDAQAISNGCTRVSMQTARRGMARKLARHGYRITGYIVSKDLK